MKHHHRHHSNMITKIQELRDIPQLLYPLFKV
nr:MAG TPA: AT-rich interactive domain-containing protein [Bacteriophage sp.]